MKTLTTVTAGVLSLSALAAAFAWRDAGPAHPAATASTAFAKPKSEPGLVRFTASDPQLSFLKVAVVEAHRLPLAEPVAGRVAYDEGHTSRITSPVLGRVTAQYVEIGDSVHPGQPLAELDSPDLAGAQADARKADADDERKRLALARSKELLDADVLARKDYENADADLRQADAEARRAHQRIANLHADSTVDGRFRLRAPIAGVVADKQINLGQEVRPDQANALLVISDLRHVWAVADVPERVAVRVHRGQSVALETDAWPGETFHGVIGRIGVAVDPVTRRVQVRCELDNADARLKPDMFARIAFVQDSGARGLPVPNTALVTEGLYSYVFVERAPGAFEKRRVHVALGGAAQSWIDAGLNPGERIVTEGALLLGAESADHAG